MARTRKYLPYLGLLGIVLAVFGNTLFNGFVWDDHLYVESNPVYTAFDLRRIFTTLANGLEYLPVRDLSYALDYFFWGDRAAGFHATSLLLYGLTAIMAYVVARGIATLLIPATGSERVGNPERVALVTALLFAVHPIHSEVVSFITCRNALLSTLFFFLACHLYLRFLADGELRTRRIILYLGALLSFVAALLAKATGIVLPLVLILFTMYSARRRQKLSYLFTLPFFALALAAFFLFTTIAARSHIMLTQPAPLSVGALEAKGATALRIIAFYLGKLLIPAGLSAEYDVAFTPSLMSPATIAIFAGLLLTGALGWGYRRKYPSLPFGLGWFILTLIPVMNFLPTHPVVADRYAYLPSFAFFFLLAATGVEFFPRHRGLVAGAGIFLLLGWGGMSIAQNRIWQSDKTLWERTISVSPGGVKAYTNLGRIYFTEGNYDRAFDLFATARQLSPADPHYDFFEGMRYFVRWETDNAIPLFEKALARDDQFIEAHYHLGVIYLQRGDRERAIDQFRRAILSPEADVGRFRILAEKCLATMGSEPVESRQPAP